MTLLLAACASSGSGSLKDVVRRDLPAAPGYLAPVKVTDPAAGESLVTVAARERAGRLRANSIITSARAQWDKLRKAYRKAR